MKPSFLWASAAAMALTLAGCLQVEQKITLMPDGSGKIEFKIGIKVEPEFFGDLGGEDPFENMADPEAIEKICRGIVAWTQPVLEEKNGWKRIRITYYFEDINKVQFRNEEQGEEDATNVQLAFEFKGSTLLIKNNMTEEIFEALRSGADGDGEDELANLMLKAMKESLKEFKLSLAVAVPGKIAEATGFTSTAGRDAMLDIGGDLLLAAMEGKKEAKEKIESLLVERKVRWEGVEIAADAVAEFQKELASAKANWPRVREEMKKQATKKKNAPQDDDEDEGDRPPMGKDR